MPQPLAPEAAAGPPALPPDDSDQGYGPPPDYNPADYRWVPVRRRPRMDGWTEEKQRRFIEVLADSGIVALAAKNVGMSRESAYKLRRSAHAAAFARAWDAARAHAGSLLEDVAFVRAIEGEERNVFDEYGEVVCTKRVVNDRLLMFLLRHLKPERYGPESRDTAQAAPADVALARSGAPPSIELQQSLRAMEPLLPAPPEELLDPQTLADELEIAEIADGKLPEFLSEQRPPKVEAQLRAEENARGKAAAEKQDRSEKLSDAEFADFCARLDPTARTELGRRRYK